MKRVIVVFLVFLAWGVGFVSAHGDEGTEFYDSHHGMMGGFYGPFWAWGMGFFGRVFMVLVIVVLVLFIVWLVRQLREKPRGRRK